MKVLGKRRPGLLNDFLSTGLLHGKSGQFKLVQIGQFSTHGRPDRLAGLLSTTAIAWPSDVDRLGGRLFPREKTKGYSLAKKCKNERFAKRLRSSRNLPGTMAFDQ